jgi:hypothetical protein
VTSKSAELRDLLRHNAAVFAAQSPQRAGFLYKSFETFVLAHGRDYESADLDADERALVERLLRAIHKLWRFRFEYKRCFENAQRLLHIDDTRTLVYIEGFVWAHGDRLPPVHHGWLSLHGKVIEPRIGKEVEVQVVGYQINGVPSVGIFDDIVDPVDLARYSEDTAVCRRLRALGIDVHLLIDAKTVHYGRGAGGGWEGNYREVWNLVRSSDMRPGDACVVSTIGEGPVVHRGACIPKAPAPGRNDPCPCGSGRKFKRCHALQNGAAP